ncbi:hypothetical protein DVH24_028595 [Malus domestica]|uniref:Iron/zinc purple acid phosphatase-like C-terminal domain-containing protein n=1 Tax=Malus domestica TaxID=3750 RepID=A0A498IXL9_MALDO|nr:hypothetical protein DVH24_028595 [Malus domestica]
MAVQHADEPGHCPEPSTTPDQHLGVGAFCVENFTSGPAAECMRLEMEELLYSYGVDIVFNGHVHAYERSNRVYDYNLDHCGPLYLTVGDEGNREKMAVQDADEPGHCPEPSITSDQHLGDGAFCAENFTSGPAAVSRENHLAPISVYTECENPVTDLNTLDRLLSSKHIDVKNETWALWTWYQNQDSDNKIGDQIYIMRQPDKCCIHHLFESWLADL